MKLLEQMQLITESEFCELMAIEPATAAAWRYRGLSPAFSKVGNTIFYSVSDVEVFIREKSSRKGGIL